jgi:hypothetical protein
MATTNKILLKKSSVQGKIPGAFDIEYGELALNFSDGRLYFKDSNNDIQFFEKADSGVTSDFNVFFNDLVLGKVTESEITNRLDLESVTNSVSDSFNLGSVAISGVIFPNIFALPTSTVANIPSDGIIGQMLLVTDEVSGPVPAFYDGNDWKRISDNQLVTAT